MDIWLVTGGPNIYRIWVPLLNSVIVTRNVTFNEHLFYDSMKGEREMVEVKELDQVANHVSLVEGEQKALSVVGLIHEFLNLNTSPIPPDEPGERESNDSRAPHEPSSGVDLQGSPKSRETVDEPTTPNQGLMTPTSNCFPRRNNREHGQEVRLRNRKCGRKS